MYTSHFLKSWEMKNVLNILNKVNKNEDLKTEDKDNLQYSIERLEILIPIRDREERYELYKDFDEINFDDNNKEHTITSRTIDYLHKLGVPVEIKKINPYESDNFSAIVSTKHKKRISIR